MHDYLQQILANPWPSLAVVANLIIIESLLSVDNAAVLATMVMDLPKRTASVHSNTASSAPMSSGASAWSSLPTSFPSGG